MKLYFKRAANFALVVFLHSFLLMEVSAQTPQQTKNLADHRRKWDTPAWTDTVKNPFANNAAITDTGKFYYNRYCTVCHGDKGTGDGVAAAGLSVRPADHTAPNVQLQMDGSLYYELTNGHAPMPAFKTVLTDKQRWACINYIRTLAKKTVPKKTSSK